MYERLTVPYASLSSGERGAAYDTALEWAAQAIVAGGLVVYPTDTLYGIGADATSARAVERVRVCKGRDAGKPILVLVADLAMLERYAQVTPRARDLAERYWPGPLSLVLAPRGDALAPVAGPDGGVGFRIPSLPWCRDLAARVGSPVTTTSVNRSGMPQPSTLDAMLDQLGEEARTLSLVLDAGTLPPSDPSTVVDVRTDTPVVLRQGALVVA